MNDDKLNAIGRELEKLWGHFALTKERLQAARQAGYKEGLDTGFKKGREVGFQEGFNEGKIFPLAKP